MKKLFMLFVLGGLLSCASLYAQDEDINGNADDEETSYQDPDDDFKPGCDTNEKVGYMDDDRSVECGE